MNSDRQENSLPLTDVEKCSPRVAESRTNGLLNVILQGPHAWKHWWIGLVRSVDHKEILVRAGSDATFSFNYVFMIAVASGIAIIGLLLNSPAVIIGAMLISPLMGPIVSTGFAIAGFDVSLGKNGARSLLLGAFAAVGFAAAIAMLSPIKELTPEILARTRPNLLDLAVAILSGAAGGYAMIRGRGGAIVGVAIATALMPPLAVVGYGLASWQWTVVRGALLLFVTNMVAIALAVAAIAEWYGFGRGGLRKRFAMQAVISLTILAPLTVPLYWSLKSIVWESRVHTTVRAIIEKGAKGLKNGQVAQLHILFREDTPPSVEAILVSEESQVGFDNRLQDEMQKVLNVPVILRLTHLRADDPNKLAARLTAERSKTLVPMEEYSLEMAIHNEVPFPLTAVEADVTRKTVTLVPQARVDVGLGAWREIERLLTKRHPDWQVTLVPPSLMLPSIDFAPGTDLLDDTAEEQLVIAAWAFERLSLREVTLIGHAASKSKNARAMSKRRLDRVAKWFIEHGVSVQSQISETVAYPTATNRIPAVEIDLPRHRNTQYRHS